MSDHLADELLDLAVALAAAAAERHRAGNSGGVDTKSTDTDPVTDVTAGRTST